jgi:hypothetical protein
MNGRVYDYNVGRFLSVDPLIQGYGNSQGINPYSYIMNNPLSGTDPTGYAIEEKTEKVKVAQTGSRIKKTVGTKTTTTVTDDKTGEVTNVTTATVMNNGNFSVNSTSYSNGKAESTTIAGGNYKAGTGASATFDIGSQEQISKSSTGAASGSSGGSFSSSWCYQGACRTGVAYDLDVRSLDEIDQGLENLTSYMSMAAGLFSIPSMVRSFFTKGAKEASDQVSDTFTDSKQGDFSISDWSGYPDGVPRPDGPFNLVEGADYDAARKAANAANNKIRQTQGLRGQPVDVHEVKPVKFGGSPTDPANKVILDRTKHRKEVTPWWNKLQKAVGG